MRGKMHGGEHWSRKRTYDVLGFGVPGRRHGPRIGPRAFARWTLKRRRGAYGGYVLRSRTPLVGQ